MPLIERTIRSAAKSGLTDFYIVIGYKGDEVRAFLANLATGMDVRITPVVNADWEAGNGLSVLQARGFVDEDFVLLMADHVFDPEILSRLCDERLAEEAIRLAVDYGVATNSRIDVEDVTKVKVEGGRITAIGKQMDSYHAYDTGIFLCSPALFEAIESCRDLGEGGSLSAAIQALAAQGRVKAFDIQGRFWMDVDDATALRRAETELLACLSTKPADGWVSRRLNRPISSGFLTPLLLKLYPAVTPNQVSVGSFFVALVSAACFFADQALAGAMLLQASSILDGCDGEIARLKHLQSKIGDYLDAVLDRYADSAMFAGLGYYAFTHVANQEVVGVTWTPMSIAIITAMAMVGHLMVSYTSVKSVVNFDYRYTGKWIAAGRGRDMRLFTLFGFGLATYVHPVAALAGLMLTAVHTNLIVGWRLLLSWRTARPGNDPAPSDLASSNGNVLRPASLGRTQTMVPTPALDRDQISRPYSRRARLPGGGTEAVIFDFDGTLADTMPFLTEVAVELIIEQYGMEASLARERYLETSGLTFAHQLQEIFPGHPRNTTVAAAFEVRKAVGIYAEPLFADTIPVLRYLREQGVKTFVCSSTQDEILHQYAIRVQLDAWVESLSGYRTGQDKSTQIDAVLAREQLAPEAVLFVGDSWKDYLLARDKNMEFILLCRDSATLAAGSDEVPVMDSLNALRSLFDRSSVRGEWAGDASASSSILRTRPPQRRAHQANSVGRR